MSDVNRATMAIIDLIQPILKVEDEQAADKIYYTLMSVMDYPNVKHDDKLSVINGVSRYLIKNFGIDSPITLAALVVSAENNKMLN